jgi:hypothetical protein
MNIIIIEIGMDKSRLEMLLLVCPRKILLHYPGNHRRLLLSHHPLLLSKKKNR